VVIADSFAWAHLPKTGGDATQRMLAGVPGLVRFADDPASDDKHLPFFAREDRLGGRLLVMNIRRLPAWALSGAQHRARHGLAPDYRPAPLEDAEAICRKTDADDLLRWMTDHGRLAVGRWLRTESLSEDVVALLEHVGVAGEVARAAVGRVGRVNAGDYEHDVTRHFTAAQIERLYALNPGWAAIEREVYGGVAG